MKKRLSMILLSFMLMAGMMSFQLPQVIGAETEGTVANFEDIDYTRMPAVRVILEGEQLAFDVDPRIVQSRTMVPMRAIFESMGLEVGWDEATKTAQGITSEMAISFTIGSNKALVNGEEMEMDVPATIIDQRTMIPLRFLSENMGYQVVWVQEANMVLISKGDILEWRYDGFEEVEPYKEWEAEYINGVKTGERRYNGLNHQVEIVNLYSADGRLIPNVPDFKVAHYGTGWFKASPFVGKTYWVDMDTVMAGGGAGVFYDAATLSPIRSGLLKDGAVAANYSKVTIDKHGFDLETWKKIAFDSTSSLSTVPEEQMLDGTILPSSDTLFWVTINDQRDGIMRMEAFLDLAMKPNPKGAYQILTKDPKLTFNWEEGIWNQLKGETPWAGMTKDMFLVQRQWSPDYRTQIDTKLARLDLWVYESDFADAVFYFYDNKLTGMW